MSKQVHYRQCRLRRDNRDGTHSEQVSYIPEPYCKQSKVLKLRDDAGNWENGWVVIGAGSERYPDLVDTHKAIRGHRDRTGDSLPKT